ncbi:MAG: Thymidylate kinase [candidate division WS2 bacterium]|uniref:Thymidylate kinase n=1 Tax=Psychracetigena formicireducens TaxID=2986056 RepID=A0A9E2BI49_PSYF1|nr:Thymidylate kinase [Candidatus Psychracetigena formicireducens]
MIRPALEKEEYVVCDRFFDSTIVYQGYGRGFVPTDLQRINLFATRGLIPDLTILLDLSVYKGFERLKYRGQKRDTFEQLGMDFHERVRQGYLELVRNEPERFRVVDASFDEDSVAELVWQTYENRFR